MAQGFFWGTEEKMWQVALERRYRVFENQGAACAKGRGEPLCCSPDAIREGEPKEDAEGFWVGVGGAVLWLERRESWHISKETDGTSLHRVCCPPCGLRDCCGSRPLYVDLPATVPARSHCISNPTSLKLSHPRLFPSIRRVAKPTVVSSNLISFSPFPVLFLWPGLSTNALSNIRARIGRATYEALRTCPWDVRPGVTRGGPSCPHEQV